MKTIKIIILLILAATAANSQWVQQSSGVTNELRLAYMLSETKIFALGQAGTLLRTTNGGDNWVTIAAGTANNLVSMDFINSNTGYIGSSMELLKTVNGGNTWTTVAPYNGSGRISFVNENTGWRGGNNASILKTTNGGENWSVQNVGFTCITQAVHFINTNTGFASAIGDSTWIIKTINGGSTWQIIYRSGTASYSNFHVRNSNHIYIVGGNGLFVRTTNGGTNWIQTQIVSGGFSFSSAFFADETTGIAVGSGGRIFATTNGGDNWVQEGNSVNSSLTSVSFMPGTLSTGFTVGVNGAILKTTNGGALGIQQISGEVPVGFKLNQNYPNPFNPVTNIQFSIPKAGNIRLVVFDVTGREVAELVNQQLSAGTFNYDFDASQLSSGMYFYKLSGDGFNEVKKMILVK